MKQQTLPTSVDYGKFLEEKIDLPYEAFCKKYFTLRNSFDAKITQQPILSQFIPCVEKNGACKPIEKPIGAKCCPGIAHDCYCNGELQYDDDEIVIYQTALSKVLFSGWEVSSITKSFIYIRSEEIRHVLVFYIESGLIADDLLFNNLTTLNLPLTETGVEYFNLKF